MPITICNLVGCSGAAAHARKTERLTQVLVRIGLSDGGEAEARLSMHLAMPTSGDTILRLVRRIPVPTGGTIAVLGVDDWAWRRGQRYGTLLCDLERHHVVDLLPERSADTPASWLQSHPGISIISRDRGSYYAQGARQGPAAVGDAGEAVFVVVVALVSRRILTIVKITVHICHGSFHCGASLRITVYVDRFTCPPPRIPPI